MAKKTEPSKYAAALQYLQQMRDRAADFGGGVVDTLSNRAQDVGGLAYEALTSDPNIGRMTTAEFSEAASRPTPRLDQAAQDFGTIGKAIVTQPIQTGKALVQGEMERAQGAFDSPRAAGEYAGSFIDPMRIAAALRKTAPIAELDVYHGTPHRFPGTEENPLGEFNASKIGTGEGVQAYGHGVYFAENPQVSSEYRKNLSDILEMTENATQKEIQFAKIAAGHNTLEDIIQYLTLHEKEGSFPLGGITPQIVRNVKQKFESGVFKKGGFLYKADLPDDMIDRMLDWDKPLSGQSETVRKAFQEIMQSELWDADTRKLIAKVKIPVEQITGKKLYELLSSSDELAGKGQFGKAASEELARRGIPGIRYLDANSRDGGSGTRNFVVFPGEEKKVKILKRD